MEEPPRDDRFPPGDQPFPEPGVEEDYDIMFGPGAFRWAEERAQRRLRAAQANAVAEAERMLREQCR